MVSEKIDAALEAGSDARECVEQAPSGVIDLYRKHVAAKRDWLS